MIERRERIAFALALIILVAFALPSPCSASFLGSGPKIGQGDALPPFTINDLKGNRVNLADYIGRKVILLDFWSIYCAPCVEQMPGLIKLYDKYKDMGLVVFGISLDGRFNARRLNKFVDGFEQQISYPIIHDVESEIRSLYGVSTLPTIIIVDADGEVKLFHIGKDDEKVIDDYVMRLLSDSNDVSTDR
jgi:peroxiredoxin